MSHAPRTGHREYYLTRTVVTPPTTLPSQASPIPGALIPDGDNLGTEVIADLTGTLRQTVPAPTLVLKAVVPGVSPAHLGTRRVRSGAPSPFGGGFSEVVVIPGAPDLAVPRVALQRIGYTDAAGNLQSDANPIGLNVDFLRWPLPASAVPALPFDPITGLPVGAGTYAVLIDGGHLVVQLDGALLLVFGTHKLTTLDGDLVVYRFRPAVDVDWQPLAALNGPDGIAGPANSWNGLLGTSTAILEAIAPLVVDKQAYVLLGFLEAGMAQLAVVRLRGTVFSLLTPLVPTGAVSFAGGLSVAPREPGGALAAFCACRGAAPPYRYSVRFASSPDLRTWDVTAGALTLGGLGDLEVSTTLAAGERITDIAWAGTAYPDTKFGWATTDQGRILRTTDGGYSWLRPHSPAEGNQKGVTRQTAIPLRAIAAARSGADYVLFAVGDSGLVMRSADSGITWKVIRYGSKDTFVPGNAEFLIADLTPDLTGLGAPAINAALAVYYASGGIFGVPFNDVVMWSDTELLIVGGNSLVLYSADSGAHFTTIYYTGTGTYRRVVVDQQHNAIVVGDPLSDPAIDLLSQGARAAIFYGVTVPHGPDILALIAAPGDTAAVMAIGGVGEPDLPNDLFATTTVTAFSVSAVGDVFRFTGNGVDGTFETIAQLGAPSDPPFTALAVANAQTLYLGQDAATRDRAGFIWQSEDADAAVSTSPLAPQFLPVGIRGGATALGITNAAPVISIGALGALWHDRGAPFQRTYPTLLRLQDGSFFVAVTNPDLGRIEGYRAVSADRPAFERIDTGLACARVDISGATQPPDTVTRPSLTQDADGALYLTAGTSGRVSVDGGATWLAPDSDRLALPLGDLLTDPAHPVEQANQTRRTLAASGRLFSTVRRTAGVDLGTFVARQWDVNGTHYAPVRPNAPIWLLDDLSALFSGDPEPDDFWTSTPDARFPARHLIVESPSTFWRGLTKPVDQILTPEEIIEWDFGARLLIPVSGFFLIETNFEQVEFSVLDSADDATWTSKLASSVVDTGDAAAITALSYAAVRAWNTDGSVKAFERDRFSRAFRQYRIALNAIEGNPTRVYRVLGNTSGDILQLDTADPAAVPPAIKTAYRLFTDRFIWDGYGGTGPGAAGLWGTRYELTRKVRIRIPEQPTAEGYFTGKALIGTYVSARQLANIRDTRPFDSDFEWRPVTNTVQSQGLQGVSAVEHFGQQQRFRLSLAAAPAAYRNAFYNAFTRNQRLREAFCLAFEGGDAAGNDKPDRCELVRHVDSPTSRQAGAAGDYSNVNFEVETVP